jgi:hypothetical protein
VTTAVGRFEFLITPPQTHSFFLSISGGGWADAFGRLGRLEPDQVVDLGNIALLAGASVGGRLTDSTGAPQDREYIYLRRKQAGRRPEKASARDSWTGTSAEDGSFQFHGLLVPGTWTVEVRERDLAGPAELEIALPETHPNIVLVPESADRRIRGVVVDDAEQPVPSARIELDVARDGWMLSSDREGHFILKRRPTDPEGPFRLSARKEGFELGRTAEKVPWGTDGVRIVLVRGAPPSRLRQARLRWISSSPLSPATDAPLLERPREVRHRRSDRQPLDRP